MPRSTFLDGYKPNFNTLLDAARRNRLALMECQDAKTGKMVAVVCAVNVQAGEYEFVPIARLFDGNPYMELNPPNPEGGFVSQEEAWQGERPPEEPV